MSIKRTRRTVLPAAFSITLAMVLMRSTPSHAADASRAAPLLDGREYVKNSIREKVGAPREIKRAPLFDNLPFLKLKAGDQLVKAKRWNRGGKGGKPGFDEKESYFILSNGKYHSLQWEVEERGDKLILESEYYSLLFDWDVTLANATLLQGNFDQPITLKSFAQLKDALRKDFPETLRDVGKVKIEAPRLVGSGKSKRAIFQGLGFDLYLNTVFKYQFEIGNETYIQFRKNLIVGPSRVLRSEFEKAPDDDDLFGGIGMTANRPFIIEPTPEEAAKKRVQYERMKNFQTIVSKFLTNPRSLTPGFE